MSETREYYKKQKYVYVVHSETRDKMYAFSNIKAAVDWFASGHLFPALVIDDYYRIVHVLRSGNKYGVHHYGGQWYISSVMVVGRKVQSSRKKKVEKSSGEWPEQIGDVEFF